MGFLDKMKTSVSGVSAQQRYASNIRKINAQIQSNEKEIERLTMQVGIQCVKLHSLNRYFDWCLQILHQDCCSETDRSSRSYSGQIFLRHGLYLKGSERRPVHSR